MIRLLLGGSKESFKTLTAEDAKRIRDTYFGDLTRLRLILPDMQAAVRHAHIIYLKLLDIYLEK